MDTKKAIKHLTNVLKKDQGYYEGWKANIAMAYIDCERWYREKNGKAGKYLNYTDRHTIANDAAEHFIKLLCK